MNRNLRRSLLIAGLAAAPADALAALDDSEGKRRLSPPGIQVPSEAASCNRGLAIDQRAAAFITALNSGNTAARVAFEQDNRSPEVASMLGLEARLDQFARWHEQWGSLDIYTFCFPVGDRLVAMLAQSERTGGWVYVVLSFDDQPPYLLRTSRVDEVRVGA